MACPKATFREVAATQAKAWRESAELHSEAARLAAARHADFDAAVKQMKADRGGDRSTLAEAEAGGERTLGGAECSLGRSRKAFDQANQKAWMHSSAPLHGRTNFESFREKSASSPPSS